MIKHNMCYELVFEIIKKYASEYKPICQNQIVNMLNEDPETACDRRTVSNALAKLAKEYGKDEDGDWINENVRLHYEKVDRANAPMLKDFWFEFHNDDGFSDAELIFLMDAVQFSKHVDKSNAEAITKKLLKLSNNRYSRVFEMHKTINEKNVPVNKNLLDYLGMLNAAISSQKMISFYPTEIGADKKVRHIGDEPVRICPYRVVVSEGNHYLLCGEKNSKAIKRFRVDRISDLEILEESYTHTPTRLNAAVNANEYIAEHCYMNTGETVDVTLEVDRKILGDVFDTFGTKITIDPAHRAMNRVTVHVRSSENDIIDWAMRYGEYAVILAPDHLRDEISERAYLIGSAYGNKNNEIEYLELIERAGKTGRLRLNNIDLNMKDSYQDLTGIRLAVFRRNGITDFSFLASYNELTELAISHNEISDPGVISGLTQLCYLNLDSTGITNLNFLTGLENLRELSIHEFNLENVEALYSLPGLKILAVNKAVANLIDKRRFRNIDGRSVKVVVENRSSMYFSRIIESLPEEEPRLGTFTTEAMRGLETCEMTDASVRASLISQIHAGTRRYNRDKKFRIVDETCSGYERLNLYEDISSFAGEEYSWYVTYDGSASEQATDIDENRILAIAIFKQDHGRKLAALALRSMTRIDRNDPDAFSLREKAHSAIYASIQYILNNNIGWAEVGGDLERSFAWAATINDLINPAILVNHNVFSNIVIEDDGYHYNRMIDGEKRPVNKIAYGHIE